ncbi:MAG: response regulator [Isosphaeraceae bacterium]
MGPEKFVLIVEDIKLVANEIERLIIEEFPEVETQVAFTAQQAEQFIRDSRGKFDFDYVILDTRLPPSDSVRTPQVYAYELPEVRWLISEGSHTVVIFNSAYDDDPRVQQIRKDCTQLPTGDSTTPAARLYYVQKGGDGSYEWIERLLDYLRRSIHSERISRNLERMFVGRSASSGYARSAVRGGYSGREQLGGASDATQSLAALARDIAQHWRVLDGTTKQSVQRHFRVEMDGDIVRVS